MQALEDKANRDGSRVFLIWDMKSVAESYSSEIDNSFFFSFSSAGKLKYRILERLDLDLKATVLFQGGQAQTRFGDLMPSGPAFLNHGFLNLDILDNGMFELQAGALSQYEVFGNNLFISKRSFPGIGESFTYQTDELKLNLMAQQVVPTTFTFSTDLVERESTPTLNTVKGSLGYNLETLSFYFSGGYFDYNDLPNSVADVSRLYGNKTDGTGNNTVFAFDFRGWMTNFNTVYSPSKDTSFRFGVDMLENLGAPKTFNQSQIIQLSAHHRFNRDLGFDIIVSDFFVESDAVPAFFTSRMIQTNRRGNGIEVGIQWLEKKVRLSAGYMVTDLINPDPALRQLESDIITINLETAYDLFN